MAEAAAVPATPEDKEKRIFDFDKLGMFTPCPTAPGKRSKLTWAILNGNPRITVYTNDPNDTVNNGMINAPMDPATFYIFLDLMRQVISGPNEKKFKVDCYGSVWENDVRQEGKKLVGEVWFGKDKDGLVWLTVAAPDRPKPIFKFKISDWHGIYKEGGVEITEAESSEWHARANMRILENVYSNLITRNIENPAPKKPMQPRTDSKYPNTKYQKPAPVEAKVTTESKPAIFEDDSDNLPF